METDVIKIGNSKGIRLSKTILDKYNIKDKLEVILESGHIILKPIDAPRKDWNQQFEKMHQQGDDKMLMHDVFHDENFDAWS
jgi:antitoxin MazE